jgi:hypothetical protein
MSKERRLVADAKNLLQARRMNINKKLSNKEKIFYLINA